MTEEQRQAAVEAIVTALTREQLGGCGYVGELDPRDGSICIDAEVDLWAVVLEPLIAIGWGPLPVEDERAPFALRFKELLELDESGRIKLAPEPTRKELVDRERAHHDQFPQFSIPPRETNGDTDG